MATTQEKEFFSLHVSGIGYLNRVRSVERRGLAQEFNNMAEQLCLAQRLQQYGEQIMSRIDAENAGAKARVPLPFTIRTANPTRFAAWPS